MRTEFGLVVETKYRLECRRGGALVWVARAGNRVVTAGLNKLLDATFKTGLGPPAWYIGLVKASVSDVGTANGSGAIASASNPWTAADAGRAIIVRGAGAAAADLVTTIQTFTDAGHVTLAANASATLANLSAAWDARAGARMSRHSPWVENTGYSDSTRPAFSSG